MREVEGSSDGVLAELGRVVEGDVVLPGSPGYEAVRRPAIARYHGVRPRAVVRCASAADVAAALRSAAGGLAVAVRSGGHCFAGRSSSDGVVIDVTPLNAVTVEGGRVTVGAGTRLGALYDALDRHGVTLPAGCGPTVGIAGLVLGGGLGILGRTYGLTCDSLRAAEVVLADGRVVTCDERREPDLFWALRGGGNGTLGVVTSLVFDTVPAPDATGFHLTWPHPSAAAVVEAWQGWAPDAPDALAASLVISTAADPDRPPVVSVFGAYVGGEAACAGLLAELADRVGEEPASAAYQPGRYREVKRYLSTLDVHRDGEPAADEEDPGLMYQKSEYFARTLPPEAVAALVEHLVTDRAAGEERELDFSPWAGAYTRVPPDATAFPHRSERFLLKHAAVVTDPAGVDAGRRWLERSWALTHPHGTGGVYPNFPDPDLADPELAYFGANRERWARVRDAYDPGRVFGGTVFSGQ